MEGMTPFRPGTGGGWTRKKRSVRWSPIAEAVNKPDRRSPVPPSRRGALSSSARSGPVSLGYTKAKQGDRIDILFTVSRNDYRGLVTPQLLIKQILKKH